MSELGALPHQVGPDGQIISGSNLSLNGGFKRVPPPLTMLPLKSSLKKKRVPAGGTTMDVSDSSAGGTTAASVSNINNTSLSPGSASFSTCGGGPDESVSSWSSDVPGLSIHNPHFSHDSMSGSPSLSTLTRTGSVKKVRIQTRQTDV
jgi:hypothetical protein